MRALMLVVLAVCAVAPPAIGATRAPEFEVASAAAVRRISQLLPPGWAIPVRERGETKIPYGFTNRRGGGVRLVLHGHRNVPIQTIVNGNPRTTLTREVIDLWILPAEFRPRLPGFFETLQLALYPSPPSFAASNARIRVYAYGASSYKTWPTWQRDVLRALDLRRDKL
jgi:hypothetical protein